MNEYGPVCLCCYLIIQTLFEEIVGDRAGLVFLVAEIWSIIDSFGSNY